MHQPPAVSWEVGPSRLHLAGLLFLMALCWATTAVYCRFQPWGLRTGALVLCTVAVSLPAVFALRKVNGGMLRWDGEHWYWSGFEDESVKQIVCVLDLQVLLLLHITGTAGAGQWLWLQVQKGRPWNALRRAVIASRLDRAAAQGGVER